MIIDHLGKLCYFAGEVFIVDIMQLVHILHEHVDFLRGLLYTVIVG
ncbi:hypothetical protein LBYZC6_51990 [Lacrimispora brassicae]